MSKTATTSQEGSRRAKLPNSWHGEVVTRNNNTGTLSEGPVIGMRYSLKSFNEDLLEGQVWCQQPAVNSSFQ